MRGHLAPRSLRSLATARTAHGFTLLELIVAAGLLALMAVFAWRGLDSLVRERDALTSAQDGIDAMQRSFARLERDAMLARDAQLDGSGALRLVSADATVDYRLDGNNLVRLVDGVDAAPVALQGGLARLVVEAWVPDGKSEWVKTRAATNNAAASTTPNNATGGAAAPMPAGTSGVQTAGNATNSNLPAALPPAAGGLTALQTTPPTATGIRITVGLRDGTEVRRVFLLGSGA